MSPVELPKNVVLPPEILVCATPGEILTAAEAVLVVSLTEMIVVEEEEEEEAMVVIVVETAVDMAVTVVGTVAMEDVVTTEAMADVVMIEAMAGVVEMTEVLTVAVEVMTEIMTAATLVTPETLAPLDVIKLSPQNLEL